MQELDGHVIGPGEVIDTYLLEAVVATGTTSTTFRARDQRLERVVTLKVLHGEMFTGVPGARERAVVDATLAASLEHPNIVPVYGAGEIGDGLWVASRLTDGDALADCILPPRRVVTLLERVAEAIDAAHVIGAVHREIRPECIVLDRWGNPLVRDYGVTRTSGRTGMATRMELLDTLRYAAPELILGRGPTPAADIYGLAATAVWCLTGAHPFPDLPVSKLVAMRTQAPPPVLAVPGADATALNAAIAEGMALDPAARPQTAVAFVALLKRAVERLPAHVAETPAPFELADADAPAAPPAAAGLPLMDPPAAPAPDPASDPAVWPATPPTTLDPVPLVVPEPASTSPPAGLPPAVAPPPAGQPPASAPPPAPPPPAAVPASAPAGATRFDRRREHEPEPVVEKPPTPWVTIVLCATIVFALGAGAAGIGAASAPKPSDPPRTGSFTLVPGATWQPAPIGRAPQMQFDSPVVFKLQPPAEALASVGVIAKQGPPGNPLAGEPLRSFEREPTPSLVRVGRRMMVRYRGTLREGGAATVFMLPTTKGALAAACSQPQAEASCAALVATAGLGGARALAPQPPEEAVTTVVDAIHRLEQARGIGAIKLNPLEKQGRDESAQAASTLAGAYQEAAQALKLEQGDAGTRAQIERVSRAALDASFAFEQLSGAIDTDDPVSYSAARSEALQADRALARALARLARSGYGVR